MTWDCQDIEKSGFFFPFPVSPDGVLVAMKLGAMLERQKGRDFYDVMFLLSQTMPDFDFLSQSTNIENLNMLKIRASKVL